mgnify:CR=1 FL=1
MNILKVEPALVTGAVSAILVLVAAFGLPLTEDQKAAVLGSIVPVLVLVQALVTRGQVTPNAKVTKLLTDVYEGEHRVEQ